MKNKTLGAQQRRQKSRDAHIRRDRVTAEIDWRDRPRRLEAPEEAGV